ncbi:MAG TPA: AmmeMemoRadiSam system protein A [Geomobilimonas sp.]|nr:AmmeMemoRadiSam system protein A [Geomobilimonas sp.]
MQSVLTNEEKQLLLEIGREAVVASVTTGTNTPRTVNQANLLAKRGCFVCIKINGSLRGCIGNFTADSPLYQQVQEMAAAAATRDPRFYPMKSPDLNDFQLEISVLSPLQKISSPDTIKVGLHGIYIEKNFSRGVLLPQVAVEQGWDRETFLSQTCLKAGLNENSWMEGAAISVFTAEVFS